MKQSYKFSLHRRVLQGCQKTWNLTLEAKKTLIKKTILIKITILRKFYVKQWNSNKIKKNPFKVAL